MHCASREGDAVEEHIGRPIRHEPVHMYLLALGIPPDTPDQSAVLLSGPQGVLQMVISHRQQKTVMGLATMIKMLAQARLSP